MNLEWTYLEWVFVPNMSQKYPLWLRSAALGVDGKVYVPAALGDEDEPNVLMSFMHEGRSGAFRDGHFYVPSDWLASNYPETAELCSKIEQKTKDHFFRH